MSKTKKPIKKTVAKKKAVAKRKPGRPCYYTDKVASIICIRLSEGQSLRQICKNQSMPPEGTVYRWLFKNDEFRERYEVARQTGLQMWADEMVEIADNASNDWMEREDSDNPGFTLNGEHIQRSRLRIDTRKWLLSKLVPKKFGDKVDQNHGSEEEENPFKVLARAIQGKPLMPVKRK